MVYDILVGRNQSDKERFGTEGSIFLGKGYVSMGTTTSLSNKVLLDVSRSHVILVSGKRGSGKSYSLSVIAEEMVHLPGEVSKNLSIIMFDTLGVFWTMKYPNTRDEVLLDEWGLKPKGMDIDLHVPIGFFNDYKEKGLPADSHFAIKESELNAEDWSSIFNVQLTEPIGIIIEQTITGLKEIKGDDYTIKDIIEQIQKNKKFSQQIKDAAENRFRNAEAWGLFSKKGTEVKDLVKRGKVVVIDISAYTQASNGGYIKDLVVAVISRKLLAERIISRKLEELDNIGMGGAMFIDTGKELEKPLVWIFIDEAHEFLPKMGKTLATDALVQLLREGRQPGISLVLATQQPGEIHKDVLTQSDLVISHRLTAQVDINALNSMMQSYLSTDIQSYMNNLPRLRGSAIILDDNSERIYPMRVRPKLSWHGGEAPIALKEKKEELIEERLGLKKESFKI